VCTEKPGEGGVGESVDSGSASGLVFEVVAVGGDSPSSDGQVILSVGVLGRGVVGVLSPDRPGVVKVN
jgi:hypothetical protein